MSTLWTNTKSPSPWGRFLWAVLILSCLGFSLYAQESGSLLLAAEMETLQKTLQAPEVSAAGRREAFARLARFLTLTGNLEGAADAWFKAAVAEPEKRDGMSLLEGARCLAAMGQFDAAGEYVRNILLTGDVQKVQSEARYLGSQIQAFRTGNGAVLASFLRDDEYADRRPSILYTLWRVTGEEAYKTRLEAEYPASLEARIIRDVPAGRVLGAPTAMWLLLPGREGIVLGEPLTTVDGSLQDAPPRSTPTPVPASQTSPPAAAGSPILQTGLFRSEENTQALAERLRKAGFTPLITRRRVNGTEYWAVGVSPGENMHDVILRLKDAGFEAFPVY
ncbi:MAG: SPOR domain-containing protein [Treponema sp.]|nr:SPOR domain-containing protein [Treponema sp.]